MNRRDLLKMISAATGTAMIGGQAALLTGCANDEEASESRKALKYEFTDDDVKRLNEVAETILPRTDTPGAKDAEVGQFMTVFVNDCYTKEEQALFHSALPEIEKRSQAEYDRGLMELDDEQRLALIRTLDREAKDYANRGQAHYFTMFKQLTLFGFFTSEVGSTKVMRHIAIPGRYDGCAPYEEGEPAWASGR